MTKTFFLVIYMWLMFQKIGRFSFLNRDQLFLNVPVGNILMQQNETQAENARIYFTYIYKCYVS